MPQLDLDGANSKISADKIQGQSGTEITVQAGHNLAGSGSGLTALNGSNISTGTVADARISALTASKLTGALPAIDGSNLTGVGVDGIVSSANATAMTIDSSEQIGINQGTPTGLLHVKSAGASTTPFRIERSGGSGDEFKVAMQGDNRPWMQLYQNGTEKIRFDAGSNSFITNNLLIGTTSAIRGSVEVQMADSTNANGNSTTSSSDWTHRVGLRLDSRCNVIGEIGPMIEFSTSGNPEALIGLVNHTQSGTQQGALVFVVKHTTNNTDMAERMRILPSGNTGIGTNNPSHILHISSQGRSTSSSWATSSDERVKENIADHDPALDTINKLRPVKFNFKKSYRPDAKDSETGFIAQEFEKVVPGSVTIVEKEKNGDEEINDFNVLSTECLTPMLVKAVQELTQQVADLKAEIKTLKG